MTTTKPLSVREMFAKCCAEESTRFAIDKPFLLSLHVCATNGHLAVRMPASACEWAAEAAVPSDLKPPDVHALSWVPQGEALVLPDVDVPDKVECERCGGDGQCCCDCGHEHDCVVCNGTGEVRPGHETIVLSDGTGIANVYVSLLRRFGVTTVRHVASLSVLSDSKNKCFYFKLGEVEGLVMGRYVPEDKP